MKVKYYTVEAPGTRAVSGSTAGKALDALLKEYPELDSDVRPGFNRAWRFLKRNPSQKARFDWASAVKITRHFD